MLLSETYYTNGEPLSFNVRLDMPKIMRAIAIADSGKTARFYVDPQAMDKNPNIVGMHLRGQREAILSLAKFGDTYRLFPNDNSDFAITVNGKNKQKFEIASDIYDVISRFNSENQPEFEDLDGYDPLDAIADSIHAEEAENMNVNRNYPAYMR